MAAFQDQVSENFDQLTVAQQDLARRVLELGERVAFMTSRQLGEAVGQSDAAIIRFAKALGYDGFPDMRDAVRARLLDEVGSSGMRQSETNDISAFRRALVTSGTSMIEETERLNAHDKVSAVVDLLISARQIFVTGHGTTYPMAVYLAMHLRQSLDKAQVFNIEHGDLADRFRSVGPKDVFIGIGYPRYLPYTTDILKLAREAGASIVAITDRASSPLARIAQQTLYAARAGSASAWWSQLGTMFIADWLNALVLARDETTITHLRRSDEEWKRLGHWKSDSNNARELSLEQHRLRSLRNGAEKRPDSPNASAPRRPRK
ncbi:MurR/RpiR family transcriptional regulator [Bradyrhizobium ivorense]|uniref:MurR/RpiR family transcriptional regulator n=1 Tax=Bradyrhizobium ivorense TaxID=2511166 RepID=UPI0010B085A7|nr:MurR/RpiR family transcriptional regulator [Bradyrhizobium ivorense]VIO69767.1 HTH-type transcriptional regulator HexR [Bradyrhizobium ivorense]